MTISSVRSAVLLVAFCGCARTAGALDSDPIELPPVTVTGVALWGYETTYDSAIVYTPSQFQQTQRPFRGQRASAEYQEFRSEVAAATVNPLLTTDIRCSAVATDATKQTTSQTDLTGRFLAANQLFTAISAANGVLGARLAIAASPPQLLEGKYVATFSVTYADGGSERWAVAPGVAPTLMIETNFPPPPSGDGVAKACPITMRS
jgi:hypothetical protein